MKCPFCDINNYVFEDEEVFAIYDKYPVTKGHLLIITKRHITSFFDTTLKEKKEIYKMLESLKIFLIDKYDPDGFNIGINEGKAAGQTVEHLHIHLIPRYRGDVENPQGGIRGVIPERKIYPLK